MLEFTLLTISAHVALGTLAVAMGAIALASRKGASFHVVAGRIFAISMGLSSVLGAVLGIIKFETLYITFHAGVLGGTLVLSGWMLARSQQSQQNRWFVIVGFVNFLNSAGLLIAGSIALSSAEAMLFGFQATDYFFLAAIAAMATIGDLRLLFRKQIPRKNRIAQHLWRMCIGFFIAAGSAFTGPGAAVFPESIKDTGILSFPELLIISLMLFWLYRTLFWQKSRVRMAD